MTNREDEKRRLSVDPDEYAREVVRLWQPELNRDWGPAVPGLVVHRAIRVGSGQRSQLVLLLTHKSRPECRFGIVSNLWPPSRTGTPEHALADHEIMLMEYFGAQRLEFESLPCETERVTWIGPPPIEDVQWDP